MKPKSGKRDHEIYENTYYIPNDKLRLLEIPMNSNLTFQMWLFYHQYFDLLYAFLLIPPGLYKILVCDNENGKNVMPIVSFVLTIIYVIMDIFRLKFGQSGNINESFPEIIAFLINTGLFSIPFTIVPMLCPFQFPHEQSLYVMNLIFLVFELVIGMICAWKFTKTSGASFYRRAAPLIDPKFRKKYEGHEEAGSSREI